MPLERFFCCRVITRKVGTLVASRINFDFEAKTRSMKATVNAVAATGGVGSGFLEESLSRAVRAGADFIGCDAGSTDAGPYYLGSGKTKASSEAIRRDTELMMREALAAGIPLLIGTAGFAGGKPHLERMLGIVRELASVNNWHFKVAAISGEVEKDLLKAYLAGRITPLRPARLLDEQTIRGAERNMKLRNETEEMIR